MSPSTIVTIAAIAVAALGASPPPATTAAEPLPIVRVQPESGIGRENVPARMTLPGFDGTIAIKVRGGWSRILPKKSYAVEVRDADGDNLNVPLLGMPADDDWVLYAAYNDRTLMRNVLAYDTARWMGHYAARSRFVELRIRGKTRGFYVLMEKPKLHDARVRGAKDAFLLELTTNRQAVRKGPIFRGPVTRRPFAWEDPEREDLDRREAARARATVARAERALYSRRPGVWRRHLHARSTVDHMLVNELFKNHDGMQASTFILGAPGRLLRLGPVWDFDISMGARGHWRPARSPAGWMLANRPWAEPLYQDRSFGRAMARRWRELRRDGLRGRLLRRVNEYERRLAPIARRDLARWPAGPHRPPGSRASHVRRLERWLVQRVAWLDRNLPGLG